MGHRRLLIILDHEPIIPAFMMTAIRCAKDRFDEVHQVNTRKPNNSDVFASEQMVFFHYPSAFERLISAVASIFRLFSPIVFKDCLRCIKEKGMKWSSIRPFIIEQSAHCCIYPIAHRIVKKNKDEDITVLATWFAACAYSAAVLKKRNPYIKAVSLAHSYEVLTIRNPYVPFMHVDFKHRYLDGVFFISYAIREMYLKGVGSICEEYINKTHVCHLGSYKDNSFLNCCNPDIFNICTCSRMIKLKRLDVLVEALADWDEGKVRWVHLGDGPLFDSLKQKAEIVNRNNPYVDIVFGGHVSNNQVKEYYASEPVDVFLNLSEIEGLPISIIEAISYGIPIIATNVGGSHEVVNEDFGILLKKDINPVLLKEALHRFWALSIEKRETMRQQAYSFWLDNFDAANNLTLLFDRIKAI